MVPEDSRRLMDSILGYMHWVKSIEKEKRSRSHKRYKHILIDFLFYVIHKDIAWENIFTPGTAEAFCLYSGYKNACSALRSLSDYLFSQGAIDHSLKLNKATSPLPDIYEEYLLYHSQSLDSSPTHLKRIRRVLSSFHEYLEKNDISLSKLKIEHCDAFMATFKVSDYSRRLYRYCLRGFLKHLYHEKKIIKRDLASFLVGPPQFAQKRLPRFLRPKQVKELFASLELSTPTQMRTYALIHIAYSLGLRPAEISKITLDDISFQQKELTLKERKGGDVIILPVPEDTIKAIALYITKGRPKGSSKYLFLNHHFPFHPMKANNVVGSIARAMKQAGLSSSAYWLRHTYAQNLLHMGQSIYEVKEMMGHNTVKSYRDTFRLFLPFIAKYYDNKISSLKVEHISSEIIIAFLNELQVERNNIAKTRNQRLAAIKSFAKMIRFMCPEYRELADRILNIPQKRTQKTLVGFLYKDEILKVFQCVDIKRRDGFRDYTLLHLLYDSGARVSEITALNIDYFDPAHHTLAILGKGDRFRIIPLEKRTSQLMQLYIKKYRVEPKVQYKHRIFINQRREELTRHGIYRLCKKYLSMAIPAKRLKYINPAHSFRHSRAVDLLYRGESITDIKNRLGHDNIQSTTVYLHLDLKHKRDIQKHFIRYMKSVIISDSKIQDLLQWENDKDMMAWLDSL